MAIENFFQPGPIGFLEQQPEPFYLGGSRGMEALNRAVTPAGCRAILRAGGDVVIAAPTADYDFYVTYSEDLLNRLLAAGFGHTVSSIGGFINGYDYYMDDEAIAIVEKGPVQVVLRKDAEFYKRVFESISPDFYAKYLWKSSEYAVDTSQIKPIFNALFAAAHAMESFYADRQS